MDRLAAMQAFVSVVDRDGFAAGARALNVAPSAVTRLISGLEDHLGVRLLNRTTRAIGLTDAGRRFLERARRILADLDEAEQMAESERAAPSGKLTIAAPLVFGRLHVGPLLCTFMNRFPAVRGELFLNDRMVNLVEDGIDIAVRIGTLADTRDIVRKVGATRRVLVASPGYLATRPPPRTPDELAAHRLIAFTALTDPERWHLMRSGVSVPVSATPAYVTNSADAAIWHAARDGGITMALSYQVSDQVRDGTLVPLLEDCEPPPYPIQCVYPNSRLLSGKVRALIEAVAAADWSFLTLAPRPPSQR